MYYHVLESYELSYMIIMILYCHLCGYFDHKMSNEMQFSVRAMYLVDVYYYPILVCLVSSTSMLGLERVNMCTGRRDRHVPTG